MFGNSLVTIYQNEFNWGNRSYTECCTREERSGIAWLLAGWKWNYKDGRSRRMSVTLLGEEDVQHTLLDCSDSRSRRAKFLNAKWLNMNKEMTYRNILQGVSFPD
jgi:hypothetical protein